MPETNLEALQKKLADIATQLSAVQTKQAELQTLTTTCSGDECSRLDKQLKATEATEARLKAIEDGLAAKLKEATDGRLATLESKLVELGGKVDGYAKAVEQPKVSENSVFTCGEENCNGILDLSSDECPVCHSDDFSWEALLESARAAVEERHKKGQ